jgi:hypothetical protein
METMFRWNGYSSRKSGVIRLMKVVINKCYGGFGLSAFAVKRYAKLMRRKCFFFVLNRNADSYQRVSVEEANKADIFFAYDSDAPDDFFVTSEEWSNLTQKERKAHNSLCDAHCIFDNYSIERHDPILVQVVEELGEEADTKYSRLTIVEIPDDTEYEINEYDGIESIHEKHRSWS